MDETLDQFLARYGGSKPYPVFEPDPDAAGWPTVLVRADNKAAVVQFMNVAADDPDAQHLCIDVHPFVAGRRARGSVFGMERGRRVSAFGGEQCDATSHGLPATHLVSVLVGRQRDTPQALVRWTRSARDRSPGQGRHGGWHTDGWSLVEDDGAWWLVGEPLGALGQMFMSTEQHTALDRAGTVVAAFRERRRNAAAR
jgi:hypothetical protein